MLVLKKPILTSLFATLVALIICKDTLAEVIQIEFTQFDRYSIEVAHIDIGDTIEWLPKNQGHNVEFLAGPNMEALPPKSKMDELYSFLFQEKGVYLYGCTPHLNTGMLGLIVVGDDFHNLEYINNLELPYVAKYVAMKLVMEAQSLAKPD